MKKNNAVLLLSTIFAILFLASIFKLTTDIKSTEERLVDSPDVTDVTDKIYTKLIVKSEKYPDASWAQPVFNDENWKEVKIPKHRIVSEVNFRDGNYAYYRIHIPKKSFQKVSHLKNELFITLQHVLFSKLDIYLNGTFFRTNSPESGDEFILNLPIDDRVDNVISIIGYIKTGDSGINHRSRIMIGKGAKLNEIHRMSYKRNTIYNLIFILSKGSILFVFVLIYLVVKVDTYFEKALLYGVFAVVEELLTGNFLYGYLNFNQQVYLYNVVEISIVFFLFLFLADVISVNYSRRTKVGLVAILTVTSFFIAFDVLHASRFFNVDHFLRFWSYILMMVIMFYLPKVYKRERVLFCIMSLSLMVSIWSAVFSSHPSLNFKSFGSLFIFIMVAYQTFILLRKQQEQLVDQEKDVAIGRTASILAHDVRRPLDQMSLILNRIASGEASDEFIDMARQEVESSLSSVNSQIIEMLNYVKTKEVALTSISFYSILSSSIKQVSVIKKNVEINFAYDFEADYKILGEESRLGSVVTNLIANAFEAIRDIGKKGEGNIRFSTKFITSNFYFTITNDGPHIPDQVINDIFKPLATFGKPHGTGLGLAAASKIALEHNGSLEVQNIFPEGVMFSLRLCLANEKDSIHLENFKQKSSDYDYGKTITKDPTKSTIRMFLLDDDRYVLEYFRDMIKALQCDVELIYAADLYDAAEIVKNKRFDLYVLDFDINSSSTGLDFYKAHLSHLAEEVVLHTSREKALFPGLALSVYPKPISFEDMKLIYATIYSRKTKLLLVEDSRIITAGWKSFHGKGNIQSVSSPEEALKYLELDSDIDVCVVDYYFDNSSTNGEQLADSIMNLYPSMKVFICSSSSLESNKYKVIKKNDYDIRKYL